MIGSTPAHDGFVDNLSAPDGGWVIMKSISRD
jgi:hypothetical protein